MQPIGVVYRVGSPSLMKSANLKTANLSIVESNVDDTITQATSSSTSTDSVMELKDRAAPADGADSRPTGGEREAGSPAAGALIEQRVARFMRLFSELSATRLQLLDDIYTSDVIFVDPFHEIRGRDALHTYFDGLYARLAHISFEFDDVVYRNDVATITWRMAYRHPRVNGGETVLVNGASVLWFRDEQVYKHRDYFDAGELLYEHLPVIGSFIRWVKRQFG